MEFLLMGLAAGLFATPHCLSMCGGFALHLSRAPRPNLMLGRQLLFHAGRTFTYAFLGGLVGALGLWVVQSGLWPGVRTGLVYFAGGVTILFGLLMLELTPWLRLPVLRLPGDSLLAEQGGKLTASPSLLAAALLGLAVGFLPCPLTVGLLLAAAGTHSVVAGMLLLGGAGLGSMPGLLVTGLAGSVVTGRWRLLGTRAVGVIVILIGLAILLRRAGVWPGGCC